MRVICVNPLLTFYFKLFISTKAGIGAFKYCSYRKTRFTNTDAWNMASA